MLLDSQQSLPRDTNFKFNIFLKDSHYEAIGDELYFGPN